MPELDTVKLFSLIECRNRASAALRELSDRLYDARDRRQRLHALVEKQSYERGVPNKENVANLAVVEALVTRLQVEYEAQNADIQPLLVVANHCEQWARERGWRPEGAGTITIPTRGVAP